MDTTTSAGWATLLRDFTQRNAGRITRLEEDHPSFGAQVEETSYPLRGAAYDPHGQSVEIMLGDQMSTDRRLTRSIAHVHALDVLTGPDGRDYVLRVAHGNGQTLLRLLA